MYSYKEIEKQDNERSKAKVYCDFCHHSLLLGRKDRKLCTHCNHFVYKDKQTKDKYKILEERNKIKRGDVK